jgi:hypothetical protein
MWAMLPMFRRYMHVSPKRRENLPHPHCVTTKDQRLVFIMEMESVFCEIDEFKAEKLGYDAVQNGI